MTIHEHGAARWQRRQPLHFLFSFATTSASRSGRQPDGATRHTERVRGATINKRYLIYNATDGVLASPEAMTHDEATAYIDAFPQRYARQGYYLTARRERIPPRDVQLTIVEV